MASLRKVFLFTPSKNFRRTFRCSFYSYNSNLNDEKLVPLEKVKHDKALDFLEKGAWNELSQKEKVALYREQFVKTIKEGKIKPKEGLQIFLSVSVLFGLGVMVLFLWQRIIEPTSPNTPEQQEAQKKKMKLYYQRTSQ